MLNMCGVCYDVSVVTRVANSDGSSDVMISMVMAGSVVMW